MAADCSSGGPNISIQQCNLLCNTDFECPDIGPGSLYGAVNSSRQIPKCDMPCWKTTNMDNNSTASCNGGFGLVEIWRGAIGPGPYTGMQFMELNAASTAKFYQDFVAIPGSTVTITFAHAGRTGYPNTMQVYIGTSISDPSPVSFGTFTGIVNTWTVHTFTYTFPLTGTNYSLIFDSLTGGAGGNFLDAITVTLSSPSTVASSNSPVTAGSTINLFATTVPSALSYAWVGPNGFTSNLQNPIILNANNLMAGTYAVTVVDFTGCITSSLTDVIITQGPCYLITDCEGIQPPFITSTDLSAYVGQTVQTCINAVPPPMRGPINPNPLVALCWFLTDCCDPTNTITVPAPPATSAALVVTIPSLYPGICWTIIQASCPQVPPNFVNVDWNITTFVLRDTCAQCELYTGVSCNIPVAWYQATNCCDPLNQVVIGSTGAFPYEGLTVQIAGVPALGSDCWQIEKLPPGIPTNNSIVVNPVVNIVTSYPQTGCADPACPTCFTNWPDGCYCVTIQQAPDCTGSQPWPGVIYQTYPNCATCIQECYLLIDCSGVLPSVLVSNDFAQYVGMVVQLENCGDTCWTVELAPDCDNSTCVPPVIASFVDCVTCLPPVLPPPPEELHPRRVKPGYYTLGCDPEYTELVSCRFAQAVYDRMIVIRYGVTVCCDEDVDKWDIKKQELDLRAIYDPEMCKNTFCICCPPCDVKVVLNVYNPVPCPAPSLVVPSFDLGNCTTWIATAPPQTAANVVYRDCNNAIQSFLLPAGISLNICAVIVFDIPKGSVVNTGVACP